MVNWMYDTLGTIARTVPAIVGGYLGGEKGAVAGYQLGATIVPTQQNKKIGYQNVSIGAYDPQSAWMRNPGNRVSVESGLELTPKDKYESKWGDFSDSVNKAAMGMPSFGSKGALGNTATPTPADKTPSIPNPNDTAIAGTSPNYGEMAKSMSGQLPSMPALPQIGNSSFLMDSNEKSPELNIPQVDNIMMQESGAPITSPSEDEIRGKKWTASLSANQLLQQIEGMKVQLHNLNNPEFYSH